jgi:bifunctional DNA-binding transcriptional regulator/antitoxin component of YhaV-PrlF toxin-antitoxin module
MSLPVDIRRRLGLTGGGMLLVEETEGGVFLRTVAQSVAHAQALARKYTEGKPDVSVDAFLANRRPDSGE